MTTIDVRKDILTIDGVETDPSLSAWLDAHADQVFRLRKSRLGAAVFHSLGNEADACRVPLNITSRAPMPYRLISNFARTPFELDGAVYQSVEGFWQGLKFPGEADRQRLADLHGSAAKDAGFRAPLSDTIEYDGATVRIGTWEHWQLMERASLAKFEQNRGAREALRATGRRPLTHEMRPDSRTIPGVILAAIWMRIRATC